ncbi:WEB family protein At5g16730, chloroplastic isoform X4 [Prunus avium]|uniref:WEB family protein At5g16730, chloroplastic isoform X1 n=1 Tax=Prunus avium TaxID=42229 RepID=A0A6P5SHF0_PRUAV|nr:WEB family protein At5g16730, chloroplastic isoform X1 [Prunus avium]XP_021816372.1 WEB family protein At5g16730, chloroplastic isoform X1 [Prunus avium]XP_021816373.1 WEB family protein At5g16730, chloroplastic isoform X1 [Prunus avium]XP_021816374.1 WEB family protein At5g16730, chloroplastic isoform X1 [Prunus avium]XP_021816375.1 WEB family protein At5g16730, chloroplastic isoform X2 [Prunus avium]XP_021816376.1 WEB family protein At5g16730, chloroplastic isoform X3 [Prunus avium]XP_02
MQQQKMEQPEEELKEQLQTMEVQRDREVDEQREMKKVADAANMRLSEELSTQKGAGVHSELNSVKDLLSDARQDWKSKEENIESLKLELGKAKDVELRLAKNAKTSEAPTQTSLSQGAERIRELELKADKAKTSEAQTKALLAESKKRIRELDVKLAENLKSSEAEAHTKALLFASEKKVRDLELKLAEKVETSEPHTKALLSERDGRIQELELKLAEKVETSEARMKALLYERELRIQELEFKLAEVMKSSEAEAHTKTLLSESEERNRELELKLAEVMKSSEAEAHTKTLLSESEERIQELEHKLAENVETSDAHTKALLSEGEGIIRELELKLAENVETSEADTKALLSESDERIRELEMEIEKRKQSEARILDSLITQTNQLEQTKVLLEEAKFEIASIHNKLEKGEEESAQNSQERSTYHYHDHLENNLSKKEELESLKSEIQLTKESLVDAQKKEQLASSKGQKLLEEMGVLKRELKLTAEAEENGKKAMDDLAFALKEVATEANQLKDKLCVTQAELEHSRSQEECLNTMLKSSEESYKALLDEAKKEAERYKNTAARLKIEHEESVLAWSGKETGFVDCIRRAEEDRYAAQQENFRLHELLLETDNRAMVSKEENSKLRDILKQALNEANVAKGATAIAQAENSQLKDTLTEKEDALNFLTRENENYRVNEIAAHENIKELKRLLIESSKKEEKEKSPSKEKESKKEAKEKLSSKEVKKEVKEKKPLKELKKEDAGKEKPPLSGDAKKEDKEKTSSKEDKEAAASQNGGLFGKVFSFNLKELKISNTHEEVDDDDDEIEIDEALKGSIFEVDSPGSATHHRRNSSFTFTDDGETLHSDDYDHLDGTQAENSRKKKALLRRFGDLIKRSTTYTKKEPSPSPDTKKEPSPSQDAKDETSPTNKEASPE